MQTAADVGVGTARPVRTSAAQGRDWHPPMFSELVEKIISALVAADATEARHLLVIFGADIGKAVGSILDVPGRLLPRGRGRDFGFLEGPAALGRRRGPATR